MIGIEGGRINIVPVDFVADARSTTSRTRRDLTASAST